jgi:hypothetical protein
VNILVDLVEQREKANMRIKLEGVLKYHNINCTKLETCFCHKIIQQDAQGQMKEEDIGASGKRWYQFVNSIIIEGIEKFPKSARLHLLHSHI